MNNIHIASSSDFAALSHIIETTHSDWTPAVLADCLTPDYFIWVIGDKNPRGFIVVRNNINTWEIMQLVIDQAYQRQGFASQLLQFVIATAQEKQIQKLILEVRASNNPALTLYEKLGFTRTGLRKNYYQDGEDAVLMERR